MNADMLRKTLKMLRLTYTFSEAATEDAIWVTGNDEHFHGYIKV